MNRNSTYYRKRVAIERPPAVRLVCLLAFMGVGISLSMLIYLVTADLRIKTWFLPLLFIGDTLSLTSIWAIWMMKRWGVLVYTVIFLVGQGVLLASGRWSPLGFMPSAVAIIILYMYFPRMKWR